MQPTRGVKSYDIIVIGGGIAGVSMAYELAHDHDVGLLEMESGLAFHTTGRSAATFSESYGGRVIRLLSTASRTFLENPPNGFDPPLLTPRPRLWLAGHDSTDRLRQLHDEVREFVASVRYLGVDEAVDICPILRREFLGLAMLEPDATDMDVHALHQGYVRGLRARGGHVVMSAPVVDLQRTRSRWRVRVRSGEVYEAVTVVNAAGAWCDMVGLLAGARPLGLQPLRRTIFMVPAYDGLEDARHLPLVIDVDGNFYLKPEGGQFLCSPADETPSEPCDARPDDLDIARAIERINEATVLKVRRVTSSWAGLRSFVADRVPVAGFDDEVEGFFWFAGQGGYGIQIAPALARATADLVRGAGLPDDVATMGLSASDLNRTRLKGLGAMQLGGVGHQA